MFVSRYMPCQYCGESLDRTQRTPHSCDPERLVAYQMFAMQGGDVDDFEVGYAAYLDSPLGRFEMWLAAQQVRGLG